MISLAAIAVARLSIVERWMPRRAIGPLTQSCPPAQLTLHGRPNEVSAIFPGLEDVRNLGECSFLKSSLHLLGPAL